MKSKAQERERQDKRCERRDRPGQSHQKYQTGAPAISAAVVRTVLLEPEGPSGGQPHGTEPQFALARNRSPGCHGRQAFPDDAICEARTRACLAETMMDAGTGKTPTELRPRRLTSCHSPGCPTPTAPKAHVAWAAFTPVASSTSTGRTATSSPARSTRSPSTCCPTCGAPRSCPG